MAVKLILFDFDGTIADTYDAFVEIVNGLSEEFGYKSVNQEDLEKLKNLSSREVIKESKIPLIKIPFILNRVRAELANKIQTLKPIQGIEPYLLQLKQKEYSLGIITSNLKDNVLTFLDNNKLDHLFDFIYSGVTLFGKDKTIKKILKQHHFKQNEVIYIGDETRDIHASKKSKIKVISVGWGFNSPEALAKHHPDFLIAQPQELIEAVENCNRTLVITQ